ncbi:MAG: iron-containing alcohol dehydrogenase [Holophaga sp.]|nr:iron-containing alcohol dehydrogenase [Holophaga sp.]
MHLLARFQVRLNRLILPFLHFPRPFTFIGVGASLSLCQQIIGLGFKRVLVVTDQALLDLGVPEGAIRRLREAGVTVEVFSQVEPDPGCDTVLAGVRRLEEFRADAILAVGGGSSMDAAKAMKLCQANHCHPEKLAGLWLFASSRKTGLPLFAIPTTAGTGSEATIAAVISNPREQRKYFIADPKAVPGMAALDPCLMTGLPPRITAATGMDVLTHAVESFLSTMATPETDDLARMATRSVMKYLLTAFHEGKDLDARERMAVASCMAGMGFTQTGVGYVHAFAHQIGGLYHVPHGLANAILLPHVLDFSKPSATRRLAELARVAGLGDEGAGQPELADAFIARIRAMNAEMELPDKFAALKRADFPRLIGQAFTEAHGTYGVPRYLNRAEAWNLLEQVCP